MLTQYRNEFDQVVVVCEGCAEDINEGVTDDRERYTRLAEVDDGDCCDICGEV